jgi:CO/xanthine dehydrogenase Mo-binding subunit
MSAPTQHRVVGVSVPRKEGVGKITGQARYIDDISMPGMWYGATVRSKIARGRIKSIRFGDGIPWDEFTVVTARDIPGKNFVPLFLEDQPLLAGDRINHPEEPILLLSHPAREKLPAAVDAVVIDYEPLPAIFNIDDSLEKTEVIWGEDNIIKRFLMEKGGSDDLAKAFLDADFIVEGEYETGAQEQLYIETNGVIAQYSPESGVTIWGSLQCPFYVHRALKVFFDLPDEKVRVVQVETGGAFGGKEDYPSLLAGHAALLSMKCGHPVKIIYDRMEDLVATTKRHPSRTRHRTAVSKEGKLLGAEIEIVTDGGAYATLSSTVLSRATIHAAGPYAWPALRIHSRCVATNTPPHGAFRGFGAPQSLFAIERHMDKVARVVGLSADELRRRNFFQVGDTTATGQTLRDPVDMIGLLNRALEISHYHSKAAQFARENATSTIKRGMGFAAFMHGSGFTGSGERYLNSLVGMEASAEGKVRILVSSAEFGQGTNTILCQIAAEVLGIDYDSVDIAVPDTSVVPNSGPTVASRTAMIVGKLVESAAIGIQQTLIRGGFLANDYTAKEFKAACTSHHSVHGELKSFSRYEAPPNIFWDDQKYQGDAYPAYAWAVYVAEVSVDTATGIAEVTHFYALQEVGRVLHPILAAGQIEGGVAQGIGYALYEKVVWNNGRMANGQMTNYIMPTSADIPPIDVYFEEIPFKYGGFGAKGIGELPMDGPAPAILNAIENATGVAFNHVPLMPEEILDRLPAYSAKRIAEAVNA